MPCYITVRTQIRDRALSTGAARIHAFDIEAGVFVLLAGVRVAFSPGEFVDFFLGWFGVDIAGDDVPLNVGDLPGEKE